MTFSRRFFLRTAATASITVAAGAIAGPAAAGGVAYAGVRIAKPKPTTATTPTITLPDGYSLVVDENKRFASPWQFYGYIQGPASEGIPVTISWPGERIDAIVSKGVRVPFATDRRDESQATITLPVTESAVDPANLRIRSAMSDSAALFYQLEHNHPGRAAGVWAAGKWPANEIRAVVNLLIGADRVLRDSGLLAAASRRGHTYYLTGFETYTTLHPDNPPHWHLGYFPGPKDSPGAYMPHLWLDDSGRIIKNAMDVDGAGRTTYPPGEPAAIKDKKGVVVVTLTVRTDGGLDITPPSGPAYSLTPPPDQTAADGIRITKAEKPWLAISAADDTLAGRLTVRTTRDRPVIHPYDRHTGQREST